MSVTQGLHRITRIDFGRSETLQGGTPLRSMRVTFQSGPDIEISLFAAEDPKQLEVHFWGSTVPGSGKEIGLVPAALPQHGV